VSQAYVHGRHARESERLMDQAEALVDLLHVDTSYAPGSLILEAGCGIGSQTVTLARRSPEARFVSIDISADSIAQARRTTQEAGLGNVQFGQADIFALPFADESFDHVFVCFVLEHLSRPVEALSSLARRLKTGGTMTVIEGDHGSTCFHPDSAAARRAVQCLVELQRLAGGKALIGRQLYPLLTEAGLEAVRVSPRLVYVDASRPDLADGITRRTFTAMIEGVRAAAIAAGVSSPEAFDAGIRDLYKAADADGVFCYTFFKAVGTKSAAEPEQPRRKGGGSEGGTPMTVIRKADEGDWPLIWPLIEPALRAGQTYAFAPDITEAQAHQAWMEVPTATYVAKNDRDLAIGTYYLKPNQQGPGAHVCNCGYIVSESARGQGVASLMCEHSQLEARRIGFRAMQFNLVVSTNVDAVRLWRKLGFDIVGTLPGAFHHPRHGFVDAFVMYKKLVP